MFDYIIVGAGAAGCVLAHRLSQDPGCAVLLLEAGPADRRREVKIPAAFYHLYQTEVDWAYYTDPEPGLNDRRLYWPRGKMLGGSTSLNAMIYIRGHRRNYDAWAAAGNEGWAYEDVLPYFRRGERQARGADDYHGAGGPLHVADLRYVNPLSRAFVYAAMAAGLPANGDFNGPRQAGVGLYQVTQKGGRRHSAADAYLRPALKRANLQVETEALATRVRFEGRQAVGVVYRQDGAWHEARARREVILCGGAVNSPQLLLLSGLGPGDELQGLGLPVVHELPGVGQNLQDHPAVAVAYNCLKPVSLAGAGNRRNLLRFLLWRQGALTTNVAEAGAFVRTRPELPVPDLQFHFGAVFFFAHGQGAIKPDDVHGFSLGPTLVTPRSRGRLWLQSPDPLVPPAIQPHYLRDPADVATLVAGIRLARRIAAGHAFDPYRGDEIAPGPDVQSDEALEDYLRQHLETLYHPVGTCKMGRDPMAVVDPALRVHGVTGLRVVDASIMPTIVNGNTQAPTMMIAEKAAEMMVQDS